MRSRFFAASWSAKSMFVPRAKWSVTPTEPSRTFVSMRVSFSVTASAASSGFAIVSSSTTGSWPGLLTFTRTVG